jgi:Holliday junction resolvasome RuvABC endonuclease subunit
VSIKKFDGGPLKESVYVGIDQSYSGFAITLFDPETKNHQTTVYSSKEKGTTRLKDIQNHLMDTLVMGDHKLLDVAMEGYAFGSQMANMLGELGGMVKLTLLDFGIHPMIVPPTNLKKFVTGKGNGVPKSQMLLFVYKKWGETFTDDNAADSYSLARLVSGLCETEYEKDVYDKLQHEKFREP